MIFSKLPPAPLGAGFFNALKAVAKGAAFALSERARKLFRKGTIPLFRARQGDPRCYLTKAQAVTAPTSEAMSATGTA